MTLLLQRHEFCRAAVQLVVVDNLRSLPVGSECHFRDADYFAIPLVGFLKNILAAVWEVIVTSSPLTDFVAPSDGIVERFSIFDFVRRGA